MPTELTVLIEIRDLLAQLVANTAKPDIIDEPTPAPAIKDEEVQRLLDQIEILDGRRLTVSEYFREVLGYSPTRSEVLHAMRELRLIGVHVHRMGDGRYLVLPRILPARH